MISSTIATDKSDAGSLVSNALNSKVPYHVDPQTGHLSVSYPLGSMWMNGLQGGHFSLSLSYLQSVPVNAYGFGKHWMLNLPYVDPQHNRVYFPNGQSYVILGDGRLQYAKLQGKTFLFAINRDSAGQINGYAYTDREGNTYEFGRFGLLQTITSNLGYCVAFIYQQDKLVAIQDDQNHEIKIMPQTDNRYQVSVVNIYGDTVVTSVELDAQGNVYKITAPTGLISIFDYHPENQRFSQITQPLGSQVKFEYSSIKTLRNPSQENEPVISDVYVYPNSEYPSEMGGGQEPSSHVRYTYGQSTTNGHNYTGVNGNFDYKPNFDAMLEEPTGYEYQTAVYTITPAGETVTVYHYNQYHLLLRIEKQVNGKTIITNTFEYEEADKPFDLLSVNYDKPVAYHAQFNEINGQYVPSSSPIYRSYRGYDDYGDLVSMTNVLGVKQKIDYYDNLFGLSRFVQQQTTQSSDSELPQYVSTLSQPIALTRDVNDKQYRKGVQLSNTHAFQCQGSSHDLSYGNSTLDTDDTAFAFGTTVSSDYGASGSATSYKQSHDIQAGQSVLLPNGKKVAVYTIKNHVQAEVSDPITGAPLSLEASTADISIYTGQVIRKINSKGLVTLYQYDSYGRLETVFYAYNTEHQSTVHYAYDFQSHGTSSVTKTDALGNKIRHIIDGLGRPILVKRTAHKTDNNKDETWLAVSAQKYGQSGEIVQSIHYGIINQDNIVIKETLDYTYDYLGRVIATVSSRGHAVVNIHDSVHNQTIRYNLISDGVPLSGQSSSLCHIPETGEPSGCKVNAIHVAQSKIVEKQVNSNTVKHLIHRHFVFAGNPNQSYAENNKDSIVKQAVYSASVKTSLSKLLQPLKNGQAIATIELVNWVNQQTQWQVGMQTSAIQVSETITDAYGTPVVKKSGLNKEKTDYLHTTTYHYDPVQRIIAKKFDNNTRVTSTYTPDGQLERIDFTDSKGTTTPVVNYQYYPFGLMKSYQYANQLPFMYEYYLPNDENGYAGMLKTLTRPDQTHATATYNIFGQTKQVSTMDTTRDYQYHPQTHQITHVQEIKNGKKHAVAYQYYPDGMAKSAAYTLSDQQTITVSALYNQGGMLYQYINSADQSTRSVTANALGQITQKTYQSHQVNDTVNYHYMNQAKSAYPDTTYLPGTLLSIDDNLGYATHYQHDPENLWSSIENRLDDNILSSNELQLNQYGNIIQKVNVLHLEGKAHKTTERYQYTDRNQMQSYDCDGSYCPSIHTGELLQSEQYTYTDFNSISRVTQALQSDQHTQITREIHYTYHPKNPAQRMAFKISYAENNAYNQSGKIDYDKNGAIINDGANTYGYDFAGKLQSITHSENKSHYQYALGNLYQIAQDQQVPVTFLPGGVKKQDDQTVYATLLGEVDQNNQQKVFLSDGINLNVVMENGKMCSHFRYAPMGYRSTHTPENQNASNSFDINSNTFGLHGIFYDAANSLYLTASRANHVASVATKGLWLSPDSGRYILGAGGLNAYARNMNNIPNTVDRSGHFIFTLLALFAEALGLEETASTGAIATALSSTLSKAGVDAASATALASTGAGATAAATGIAVSATVPTGSASAGAATSGSLVNQSGVTAQTLAHTGATMAQPKHVNINSFLQPVSGMGHRPLTPIELASDRNLLTSILNELNDLNAIEINSGLRGGGRRNVTDMQYTVGQYTGHYTGATHRGQPDGEGTFTVEDVWQEDLITIFEGTWSQNVPRFGTLIQRSHYHYFSDNNNEGYIYRGEVNRNLERHGFGSLADLNNRPIYEGRWANDSYSGIGSTFYSWGYQGVIHSRLTQTGFFQDSELSGFGTRFSDYHYINDGRTHFESVFPHRQIMRIYNNDTIIREGYYPDRAHSRFGYEVRYDPTSGLVVSENQGRM